MGSSRQLSDAMEASVAEAIAQVEIFANLRATLLKYKGFIADFKLFDLDQKISDFEVGFEEIEKLLLTSNIDEFTTTIHNFKTVIYYSNEMFVQKHYPVIPIQGEHEGSNRELLTHLDDLQDASSITQDSIQFLDQKEIELKTINSHVLEEFKSAMTEFAQNVSLMQEKILVYENLDKEICAVFHKVSLFFKEDELLSLMNTLQADAKNNGENNTIILLQLKIQMREFGHFMNVQIEKHRENDQQFKSYASKISEMNAKLILAQGCLTLGEKIFIQCIEAIREVKPQVPENTSKSEGNYFTNFAREHWPKMAGGAVASNPVTAIIAWQFFAFAPVPTAVAMILGNFVLGPAVGGAIGMVEDEIKEKKVPSRWPQFFHMPKSFFTKSEPTNTLKKTI